MRSPKEIRAEIEKLGARVVAIVEVAKSEERDLTAEETQEIDAINGAGENKGKIVALQAELERAEKIEQRVNAVYTQKTSKPEAEGFKVPAKAKASGKLFAFKDEKDAYICGQQVLAGLFNKPKAKRFLRDNGIKASMASSDNTTGGFLVPEPMENAIIELREQYGVWRQNAQNWPMSDGVTIVPKLAGEVTAYYVGEGSTITASDATVQQIKLEAKKLATMTLVSSELNEDAVISIAEMIARSVAYQFAVAEDSAGFLGDGTSTYGGIVGLASALAAGSLYTATSRTTFSALTFADFESVIGQCKMWSGIQPKWYISQAGWAASMQRLMNAAGGVTMAELSAGARPAFLGYPVVVSQVLTSALTGTSGARACYFGDLAMGSYLGTRRGINLALDSSRYFEQDSIAIRATQRFDIQVHDRGTASASGGIIGMVFG